MVVIGLKNHRISSKTENSIIYSNGNWYIIVSEKRATECRASECRAILTESWVQRSWNPEIQKSRNPETLWHVMSQLANEPVTNEPLRQWFSIKETEYRSDLNFSNKRGIFIKISEKCLSIFRKIVYNSTEFLFKKLQSSSSWNFSIPKLCGGKSRHARFWNQFVFPREDYEMLGEWFFRRFIFCGECQSLHWIGMIGMESRIN